MEYNCQISAEQADDMYRTELLCFLLCAGSNTLGLEDLSFPFDLQDLTLSLKAVFICIIFCYYIGDFCFLSGRKIP